ncbi:helix-turn-helix domain-containing protein [Thermomonospora amylolytica]|uniref:helix-turn-helix domain-containing protein n=1 Tax=Thermomonospora amylolytica TaxID=1411117 RepID=UPI000E6C8F05|nr:helix-turn-helix transcriptional regulator [Thermomonospora amylolytica]
MPGRAQDPLEVPADLWQRPETLDALRNRDIGRLFRLLRQYAGASQTQIAIACGMTQGKVSETMKPRGRQVTTLEVFERIADGLDMPDPARMTLGLAPRSFDPTGAAPTPAASIRPKDEPADLEPSTFLGSLDVDPHLREDGSPLRRRTFNQLAGASLFSAILADLPGDGGPLEDIEAFAAALTGYPDAGHPTSADLSLDRLTTAVATANRDYQNSRYSALISDLPALLAGLRNACDHFEGDSRLRAEALSAQAHQIAAGVLFKLGAEQLRCIAAERSMQAARNSQDPIVLASSIRSIINVLMNDGHHSAAITTASTYAQQLGRDIDRQTPESLSVYGSLLLRGAEAAGQRNDRHTAATLLDEAEDAGRRLGGDHNYRWTAFGPTNVQLYRVNIALQLGDAGAAIQEARTINLDRIPLTERKATLLIDTARALTQWGKHEKAYEILRAAHQLAPEEISARPAVHRMVRELAATAPPSTKRQLRDFTTQIGVRL